MTQGTTGGTTRRAHTSLGSAPQKVGGENNAGNTIEDDNRNVQSKVDPMDFKEIEARLDGK